VPETACLHPQILRGFNIKIGGLLGSQFSWLPCGL